MVKHVGLDSLEIPSLDTSIFFTIRAIERRSESEIRLAAELSDQHGWRLPLTATVAVTRSAPSALGSPVVAEYFNPGGGVLDAVQTQRFGRLYYVQTSFSGTLTHDHSAKADPVVLTLGSGSLDHGTMIGLGVQTPSGIVYANSY